MRISLDILILCLSTTGVVAAAKKHVRSNHKCPLPAAHRLPKHSQRSSCSEHSPDHARPTGKRKPPRRSRSPVWIQPTSPASGIEPPIGVEEPLQNTPYSRFTFDTNDALAAPLSAITGSSPSTSIEPLTMMDEPVQVTIASASSWNSNDALGAPLSAFPPSSSFPSDWLMGLPLGNSPAPASSTVTVEWDMGPPLQATPSTPSQSSASSTSSRNWDIGEPLDFRLLESTENTSPEAAEPAISSISELSSSVSASASPSPSSAPLQCSGQSNGQCVLVGNTAMRVHCNNIYDGTIVLRGSFQECLDKCGSDGCKAMAYGVDYGVCYTSGASGADFSPGDRWTGLIEDDTCPGVNSGLKSASAAPELSSTVEPSTSSVSRPSPSPTVYDISCENSRSDKQCVLVGSRKLRLFCHTYYPDYPPTQVGTLQECLARCASDDCESFTYTEDETHCYIWPSNRGKPEPQADNDSSGWTSAIEDGTCPNAETVDSVPKLLKRMPVKAAEELATPTAFATSSKSSTTAVLPSNSPPPAPACFAQTSSKAPRKCLTSLPSDCQSLASITDTVPSASGTDSCRAALIALRVEPPAECFTANVPNNSTGSAIFLCLAKTVFCETCITGFPRQCTTFFSDKAVINNSTLVGCQTALGSFGAGPAASCLEVGDTVSELTGVNVGLCIQRLVPVCPSGRCAIRPPIAVEVLSAVSSSSRTSTFGLSTVDSSMLSFSSFGTMAPLSSTLISSILLSSRLESPLLDVPTTVLSTLLSSTLVPLAPGSSILGSSPLSSLTTSTSSVTTSTLSVTALTSPSTSTPTATRAPCVNAIPDACQVPDFDQLEPLFLSIDLIECQNSIDALVVPNPAEECFSPSAFISYTGQDFAICLSNSLPVCPPCLEKLPPACFEATELLGVQCLVALGSFGSQAANLCFTNGMLNRAVTDDLTQCLTRVLICA